MNVICYDVQGLKLRFIGSLVAEMETCAEQGREEVPGFTTFLTCPSRAQTKGENQEVGGRGGSGNNTTYRPDRKR